MPRSSILNLSRKPGDDTSNDRIKATRGKGRGRTTTKKSNDTPSKSKFSDKLDLAARSAARAQEEKPDEPPKGTRIAIRFPDGQSSSSTPKPTRVSLTHQPTEPMVEQQSRVKPDREKRNGNSFSIMNRKQTGNRGVNHNSCIVCLKINKSLYQKIFKEDENDIGLGNGSVRSLVGGQIDPQTFMNHNLELSEMEEVKTLEIPDIYSLTELDIRPEKVQFKHYNDLDADVLNQKLNSHRSGDKRIHLILAHFKDKNGWPNNSNYACWNCTEYFTEPPIGIPKITSSNNYKDEYHLEGNFCSFNCAARYLFDTHQGSDNQLWTLYEILNYIYNAISESEQYVKIKPAPERICLKKFGGHLTLEEYRENHMTNVNYKVFKGQLIPSLYHIQENADIKMMRRRIAQNMGRSS